MENDSSLDIRWLVGILITLATGGFGFLKWLDSRKIAKKDEKVAREDWLVENALNIVKGLREELDRLRVINEQQSKDLTKAYNRVAMLERELRKAGIIVPDA